VVLAVLFRTKALDTEPFIIVVRENDVNADSGILFFKFRNFFSLDRKIDSVQIESILVPDVVKNTTGVAVCRIQRRQNRPHKTFVVSVNDIGDCLFSFQCGAEFAHTSTR